MKLSIVIPAYNVENLILRCLKSVLNQDLPLNEFEVIVVDDGSTDNTYKVVEGFILDKNNITLINQKNQKQGAARNTALKIAKGEYVWFVDSDDYVESNCFRFLYEKAKEDKLDMLFFYNYKVYKDNIQEVKIKDDRIQYDCVYSGQQIINYKGIICSPWPCIFNRKYLSKNNLKFIEGVFYEDNDFMLRAFYSANRISYTKNSFYYVDVSNESTTRSTSIVPIFDILKVVTKMLVFTDSLHKNRVTQKNCMYYSVMLFNTALSKVKNHDDKVHEQFLKEIDSIRKPLVLAMFKSLHPKYIFEGCVSLISFKFLLKTSKLI